MLSSFFVAISYIFIITVSVFITQNSQVAMSVFFCDELLSVSEKFCVLPKGSFSGSPPSKGDLEGLFI